MGIPVIHTGSRSVRFAAFFNSSFVDGIDTKVIVNQLGLNINYLERVDLTLEPTVNVLAGRDRNNSPVSTRLHKMLEIIKAVAEQKVSLLERQKNLVPFCAGADKLISRRIH